jgi:hypothetical protein
MSGTVQQLVNVRSSLAETIEKYYLALIEKAEHTPWGTGVRASAIEIPARVLKEDTRPERERRSKREREEDDREDSRDWRPQMDPSIAALYEQPIGEKEEAPWEQERLNVQRAVILGAPGGGKTFLTQTTALALAKQGLEEREKRSKPLDQLPLPIRVDLNDLASESGSDDLLDILAPLVSKNYKLPALEPWLRRNLKADNCWLILDALDQVDSDHMVGLTRRLESIRDGKCHALVTCRKANYDRAGIPWTTITEYELAPFDATEIAAFITRWHAGKDGRGEQLNEVVGRSYSLQQACGTPLMLTLACLANEEEALTEETRRVDLYWMVLRGILRNAWREPRLGPSDPRIDDLLRMLRPMAWELFMASPSVNQFPSSRVVEAIEVGANAARLPDSVLGLRGELVDRGLLVNAGVMRGEGQFSFLHRSFQEFLVAEYLGREADGRGWEAIRPLLDKKSWAPEWQEVIVLLGGTLKNPLPLLEMLRVPEKDDLFRHRLALAAQSLGELSAEVECTALINDVTAQAWFCYGYHEFRNAEIAVPHITRALPALAKLDGELRPGTRLLAQLVDLVRSPIYPDADVAALTLKRMGTAAAREDVIRALLEWLLDNDPRAGPTAAMALAAFPDSVRRCVADQLANWLGEAEKHVQSRAALALVQLGPRVTPTEVVDRLIEWLVMDVPHDCESIELLGEMGAAAARTSVINRLMECLGARDRTWSSKAAKAFGKLGPLAAREDVLERLAECQSDSAPEVRYCAADALRILQQARQQDGIAGRDAAQASSLRALRDDMNQLSGMWPVRFEHGRASDRRRAIEVLRRLGPVATQEDAMDRLLASLQVPVRERADQETAAETAATLGLMGSAAARPEIVEELLSCLRDPSEFAVPFEAAEALARMMSSGARFFRAGKVLTIAWVKDLSR